MHQTKECELAQAGEGSQLGGKLPCTSLQAINKIKKSMAPLLITGLDAVGNSDFKMCNIKWHV